MFNDDGEGVTKREGDGWDTIRNSEIPVLLFFHAPWCVTSCKLEPIIRKLEVEFRERVNIIALDVTTEGSRWIATRLSIHSVPALVLFKDGQLVEQVPHRMGEEPIRESLSKVLVNKVFCG